MAEYKGGNRDFWTRRPDFPAIAQLLRIALACESDCVPNFLENHIGLWHRRHSRSWNFIGIKGSRHASFSLEIKIDEDHGAKARLERHGWYVEAHHHNVGYRTHLPETLTRADLAFLKPFIEKSHADWTSRGE